MVNTWGSLRESRQKAATKQKETKQNGTARNPSPPEPELSELDKVRASISKSFDGIKNLWKAVNAPVPTSTGDGSYLPQPARPNLGRDVNAVIRDIGREDVKDVHNLMKVVVDSTLGRPLNDREYLMESLVGAAAALDGDFVQTKITDTFLTTLWNDLDHPPQQLLSDEYKYRQPDGSKNSYSLPDIGKAGMPYARTATPKIKQASVLPDPGVLFDTLMARKEPKGTEHPNHISSMLFYLASIIIHDVFRTSHEDYNISKTSSYLDLAPLYGSNWEEQKRMRTFQDGKIKPDCFSETRLLTFPPGVGALLIMFNRYHNYVVEQLASINEDGRFSVRKGKEKVTRYGESIDRRDDDLFQTARLITCGLYINIILIDYVRTILNLNRTDSNWQLNPRAEIAKGPATGTGNQCAAEFNLVYRWHSAISERDDKWTQQLFQELPLDPELKTSEGASKPQNLHKFLRVLSQLEAQSSAADPQDRPFPALKEEQLKRIPDGPFKGSYKDDDLAAILSSSIEDCANALGPQQVPPIMKVIEILGIQQARTWKLATLNEFRKHFSLTPHETWDDITVNKEVQEALKHLYDTPDQVELYPGLVIEDAKLPKLPGSGLCLPYTASRSVLSDAVALVRGDRFYTESYTPATLTNWGFQEASSDLAIDNGCVFYKLFLRALPNNYDPASVYVHYPMTVPAEMQRVLKGLDKAHLYNFDKPKSIPQPKVVFSYETAINVLKDQETFNVTWGKATTTLLGQAGSNFMLAGDGPKNAESRKLMEPVLYLGGSSRKVPTGNEKWLTSVRTFIEETCTKLLKEKSSKLAGANQVDIIRDVGNLTFVHFAAEMFSIPLKTADFPRGIFSEQQLYLVLAAVFIDVFFDLDPAKSFPLRKTAKEVSKQLGQIIEAQVEAVHSTGRLAEWLINAVKPTASPLKDYGVHMMAQLCKQDRSVTDIVWGNIMGTLGGMVANQGQLLGQALDYLFTDGAQYLPEINRLAKLDTAEADDKLLHYFLEAARLNGETGVFRYATKPVTITDTTDALGAKTYSLQPGDTVMVNLKAAARDPRVFPNPDVLDLNRPVDSYIVFGYGPHECLGKPMCLAAMTSMMRVIGRLDNLRPATVAIGRESGPSRVKKIVKEFVPGDLEVLPESWHYHLFMTEDWDQYFPFPTSLKIQWDGDI